MTVGHKEIAPALEATTTEPNSYAERLKVVRTALAGAPWVSKAIKLQDSKNPREKAEGELILSPEPWGLAHVVTVIETLLEKCTQAESSNSKQPPEDYEYPLELTDDESSDKELVALYPDLFPIEQLLNNPEAVLATLEEIIKKTYPPEVVKHLSLMAEKDDESGLSFYLLRIHANPVVQAPAPDEVR